MSDIRTTRPYFRFKRGTLTLFIETTKGEKLAAVKSQLVELLHRHEGEYEGITDDQVKLLVGTPDGSAQQYTEVADKVSVGKSGLVDNQEIYFVLMSDD
ncbi:hypothetical protein EC988_007299, partial [Linderina pennispora]